MNAAIAGFSSGVCTIPVSYSIKAQDITSQLYISYEYIVVDVYLSVDDLLDLEYSIPHIDKVWNERRRHAAILQAQRSENQRLAMINLELLHDALS
jgi:polysaccharide pyruvyl transferase WcaK-like protein